MPRAASAPIVLLRAAAWACADCLIVIETRWTASTARLAQRGYLSKNPTLPEYRYRAEDPIPY